ncbi:hypothetical protein Tco_1581279, partial [Tanacetum coccineum]
EMLGLYVRGSTDESIWYDCTHTLILTTTTTFTTTSINCHQMERYNQTLTNGAKRKLDHLLFHLVNGLLWKTNDESGTPHSQSGWKTSWAKKDDKEDQCASRVEDSSNTNQWGKKEAGSSPSSSG